MRAIRSIWAPSKLFTDPTVNGVWFDPNDSTTLFEDASGAKPAVLEGPVGSMLDLRDTAYSTYFDGTGDYLTLDGSSGFAFGTGDFTIEMFAYFNRVFGGANLYDSRASTEANRATIYVLDGTIRFFDIADRITSGNILSTGQWYHITVCRSQGTTKMFVNGSQIGSNYIDSTNYGIGASRPVIGSASNLTQSHFHGYISNLRIVKGTALYTANFTPPTAPLTPVAGTSLLTCGTSWSGNPAITAVGDARVDSRSPFKVGKGNHAYQLTSTKRPVLTRRVNQSVATRNISAIQSTANSYLPPAGGQYWAYSNLLLTNPCINNTAIAPDGSASASTINSSGSGNYDVWCTYNVTAGVTYKWSGDFKLGTASNAVIVVNNTTAWDTVEGSKAFTAQDGLSTSSWARLTITFVAPATGKINIHVGRHERVGITQQTVGTFFFANHDLREANIGTNLPPYQRVDTPTYYDTVGFPAWLRCSGGQAMVTNSINFTGTNKVSVFTGLRKGLVSGISLYAETSSIADTTNGAFVIAAPVGSDNYYASHCNNILAVRGVSEAAFDPPHNSVFTSQFHLSGSSQTEIAIRVNGNLKSTFSRNQGVAAAGNYGNHPLNLFSRNQTTYFFTGLAGPFIIRGAQSSAEEIASAEAWINSLQKVY